MSSDTNLAHSSERFDWETPPEIFAALDREFGFTLDVCASPANAKCARFFTVETNGLGQSWRREVCWMNPPYGRDLPRWMRKAHAEAAHHEATVVCLVPARTHTRWFHSYCQTAEVRFLRGRLRYVGSEGEAPFPQLVIVLRAGLAGPYVMRPWDWKPDTRQAMLRFDEAVA